jgi:hypothetical protein
MLGPDPDPNSMIRDPQPCCSVSGSAPGPDLLRVRICSGSGSAPGPDLLRIRICSVSGSAPGPDPQHWKNEKKLKL